MQQQQQQHRAVECSLGEAARLHALIMLLLAWTHCFPPVATEGIAELNKNKQTNSLNYSSKSNGAQK